MNTKQIINNLPVIALVGRVNVGKSTLFNKLIEEDKAIVSTTPGTTRTNNEGVINWRGSQIKIIDTGGLTFTDEVVFEEDILRQSEFAIKEADIILFVADGQSGILPQEKELAKKLRRIIEKPVILIANKVDNKKYETDLTQPEWSKLGLGQPFPISSTNGRNVGDLLDKIFEILKKSKRRPKKIKEDVKEIINISLIGKPNVGKSSLFNKLIGQEKVIVSDLAHTTREPHDTVVEYEHSVGKRKIKQNINFVDTAGMRRKSKVKGELERIGIRKTIESIDKSDIILLVLDGKDPMSSQDRQLGGLLERHVKSVIILVNKWDLTADNSEEQQIEVKKLVYSNFPHLNFAPIMFVSGKTSLHVHKIFPMIMKVWQGRQTKVPIKALEYFLEQVTREHRPSRGKGTKHPKILGLRQLDVNPPVFEMIIKFRTSLHTSYVYYIENKLREKFDFFGTPIVIKLTKMRR